VIDQSGMIRKSRVLAGLSLRTAPAHDGDLCGRRLPEEMAAGHGA
jgi:hypothetical protein